MKSPIIISIISYNLLKAEKFINDDGFNNIIVESIKQHLHVFQKKNISNTILYQILIMSNNET